MGRVTRCQKTSPIRLVQRNSKDQQNKLHYPERFQVNLWMLHIGSLSQVFSARLSDLHRAFSPREFDLSEIVLAQPSLLAFEALTMPCFSRGRRVTSPSLHVLDPSAVAHSAP